MSADDDVRIFVEKVETWLRFIAALQRDIENDRYAEAYTSYFLAYMDKTVENSQMFFALDELPKDRDLRGRVLGLLDRLRGIRAWLIARKPNSKNEQR